MTKFLKNLLAFAFFSIFLNHSFAASGILSMEEANSADSTVLMEEVAVFKSIREGISLTLAQCDASQSCQAAVSSDEVQGLIDALDARVEGISLRQQEAGNYAGLEEVMVSYAEERGGLLRALKKIGDNTSAVVENIDENELFGDETESTEAAGGESEAEEQFGDVFSDEDEEL